MKMAQRSSDFFITSEDLPVSPAPALLETRSVTEEASEREKQRRMSRGWRKMLTAAMDSAPKAPTMIRSVDARRIIKSPSNAAGSAILKYFLS